MHRIANVCALLPLIALAACGGSGGGPGVPDPLQPRMIDLTPWDADFEAYAGDSYENLFENGYTGRINPSLTTVYSGSQSVRFENVEVQEIRVPSTSNPSKIPVTAGKTYRLRVWMYAEDVVGGASPADVTIEIVAAFAPTAERAPEMSMTAPDFGVWTEVVYEFVALEGALATWFQIGATGAGETGVDLFLDAFTLEELP